MKLCLGDKYIIYQSQLVTPGLETKAGLTPRTYTTELANSPITDAPDDIDDGLSGSFQLRFRRIRRFRRLPTPSYPIQKMNRIGRQLTVWAHPRRTVHGLSGAGRQNRSIQAVRGLFTVTSRSRAFFPGRHITRAQKDRTKMADWCDNQRETELIEMWRAAPIETGSVPIRARCFVPLCVV